MTANSYRPILFCPETEIADVKTRREAMITVFMREMEFFYIQA
tara:strand:- start:117 stop:245 length:129 start_codon:yes stop_codon:yes gene_type:complete